MRGPQRVIWARWGGKRGPQRVIWARWGGKRGAPMRLEELNTVDAPSATRELLRCCGSARWAQMMVDARPFASLDAMTVTADRVWTSLDPVDWLEAFAAHPRIGQQTRTSWEAAEQAAVTDAVLDAVTGRRADGLRAEFERLNREYEQRFGHLFLISATGRSAEEMLRALEERLRNNPDDELRIAAAAQQQITRLRLARLLGTS